MDQISEEEFEKHCQGTDELDKRTRPWLSSFYKSVLNYGNDRSGFRESMRGFSDVMRPEWDEKDVFIRRIWNEEFFLARHEAGR